MQKLAPFAAVALILGLHGASAADDAPVSVMVVGTFHMSNPGLDMHNAQVDDVLSDKRQAEIKSTVAGLAKFKPTVVAVEWPADITNERYAAYRKGTLKPSRNEVVQVGFRLAKQAGLREVRGVDVDGDFPYGPVAAYAKAHGQSPILDAANLEIAAFVKEQESRLADGTVGGVLRWLNDPSLVAKGNGFYRKMLLVGGGTEQPGADLLTAWYKRNFLICANLVQLAKPGDRVVLLYGSGHSFLLRQCVGEMPGYVLVEANDFLPQ